MTFHVPVLAPETADMLVWRRDGCYVDGTLGDGGHAAEIARRLERSGCLIGMDRDPSALERARMRLKDAGVHTRFLSGTFGDMDALLREQGVNVVSGILLDLGVSSPQLDTPERGFSYRFSGPLDMRMGPDAPETAAQLLARVTEEELAGILARYGEVPDGRRISRAICRARDNGPLESTGQLAEAVGSSARGKKEKLLSQVFQALRIAVNRELEQLESALEVIPGLLEPGGTVVIIAYHSLEDRLVKQWMRTESADCICPPGLPVCRCDHTPRLELVSRRAVKAGREETAQNRRARSARLRAARRLPEAA